VASLSKQSKSVDELFQLADVARLSGHPSDAIAPLRTIITDNKKNPKAGLAAYILGRIYLEQLFSYGKAVDAFDEASALGIPEALQEAAAVKTINALLLQQNARGLAGAEAYLTQYPEGRYRKQVQGWIKENGNTSP
jgi:transmembrane sensor